MTITGALHGFVCVFVRRRFQQPQPGNFMRGLSSGHWVSIVTVSFSVFC